MENIEKQNKITHGLLAIIIILLAILLYWFIRCGQCNVSNVSPAPTTNTSYVTNNTTTNKYYQYTNPDLGVVFVYPASWGQVATNTTPCPAGTVFVGTVGGVTFGSSSAGCVQIVPNINPVPPAPPVPNPNPTTTGTGNATGGQTTTGKDQQPPQTQPQPTGNGQTTIQTTSGDTGIVTRDPQNPTNEFVTFYLQKGKYPTVTFEQGKNVSAADFMALIKSVDITK